MNKKANNVLVFIFSIALFISGFFYNLNLVNAEDEKMKVGDEYKIGDTVIAGGSKENKTYIIYYESRNLPFDLPYNEYTLTYDSYDANEQYHRLHLTGNLITQYVYLNCKRKDMPWGMRVISGDGTQANPFRFELIENPVLTFNLDGGIIDNQNTYEIKCEYKNTITLPEPTKEGYTFSHWQEETNTYQAGENYTANDDKTFTAVWDEIAEDKKYNLTINKTVTGSGEKDKEFEFNVEVYGWKTVYYNEVSEVLPYNELLLKYDNENILENEFGNLPIGAHDFEKMSDKYRIIYGGFTYDVNDGTWVWVPNGIYTNDTGCLLNESYIGFYDNKVHGENNSGLSVGDTIVIQKLEYLDLTSSGGTSNDDGSYSFKLKDSDHLTIENIPDGYEYVVTESDYSSDNYSTTVDGIDNTRTVSGIIKEDTTHEFINNKDTTSSSHTLTIKKETVNNKNGTFNFEAIVLNPYTYVTGSQKDVELELKDNQHYFPDIIEYEDYQNGQLSEYPYSGALNVFWDGHTPAVIDSSGSNHTHPFEEGLYIRIPDNYDISKLRIATEKYPVTVTGYQYINGERVPITTTYWFSGRQYYIYSSDDPTNGLLVQYNDMDYNCTLVIYSFDGNNEPLNSSIYEQYINGVSYTQYLNLEGSIDEYEYIRENIQVIELDEKIPDVGYTFKELSDSLTAYLKQNIELNNGESTTISDLPHGYAYKVYEVDENGNKVSVGDKIGSTDWKLESITGSNIGTLTQDTEVTFTNKLGLHSITVVKEADTEGTFNFYLLLKDANGNPFANEEFGEYTTSADGYIRLTINSNNQTTIPDIPEGSKYEVYETDPIYNKIAVGDTFDNKWKLVSQTDNSSGTLTQDTTVKFVNELVKYDLSIVKETVDNEQGEFTFNIKANKEVEDTSVAYAVVDSSDGSLTFFRDEEGKYTEGQVEGTKTYYTDFENTSNSHGWTSQAEVITTVTTKDPIKPINTRYWFSGCKNIINFDLSKMDTKDVTDMEYMFSGCESITSLDLSTFNTSNVKDMGYMFNDCKKLANLDISSFDTANVANMWAMFMNCESITSLDLSNFDTGKLGTDRSAFSSVQWAVNWMFDGCKKLESLNLSTFDTTNVIRFTNMFSDCQSLKELDLSSFSTKNAQIIQRMFQRCYKLEHIYVSDMWDTSRLTYTYETFAKDELLPNYDPNKWDGDMAYYGGDGKGYLEYKAFNKVTPVVNTDNIYEFKASQTVYYDLSEQLGSEISEGVYQFKLSVPEKDNITVKIPYGYEYEVYEVDSNGNRINVNDTIDETWTLVSQENNKGTIESDIEAKFINKKIPQTYTLTYKLNGGTYKGSTADIIRTYTTDEKVYILDAPTRSGYKFLYWDGSEYYPGQEYTLGTDHVLTAIWQKESTPTPVTPKYVTPKTGIE